MTVHMPAPSGPEPASDTGLVPDRSALPAPEVMDAAYAAYKAAGGGQPPNQLAFLAAVVAGVVTDRGLQDAARVMRQQSDSPGKPPPCAFCNHSYAQHAEPDACLGLVGNLGCPCDGHKVLVAVEDLRLYLNRGTGPMFAEVDALNRLLAAAGIG